MKDRIYVCHTFYHVYVTCLKEFRFRREAAGKEWGKADLLLSSMSNRFGNLEQRAKACGIFRNVVEFDEKPAHFFEELQPLQQNTGSLWGNMRNRIRFCRRLGELEEPYIPVDFREYGDIYVFCDSDPVGYYLNYKKIPYHAVEDGLDCIRYFDAARFDNRGHFRLKAFMAALGLIFIQNGYSRYCIDMEVNNIAALKYPCKKYVELPRKELTGELTEEEKEIMLRLFVENMDELQDQLQEGADRPRVLILSEPLCDPDTRKRLFRDLADTCREVNGEKAVAMMKQHPRDLVDYREVLPDVILLAGNFPMEMLNFIPGLYFDRVVSVYTVVDSLQFVKEKMFLGHDFMDRYEEPSVHRKNEQIGITEKVYDQKAEKNKSAAG